MISFGPDKDPTSVVGYLRDVQKQMNYASARTANNLALRIQRFTLDTLLPGKFTLRAKGAPWQKPGTRMGFNIKFATKDNPQAKIGSQADWLERQEFGGDKTATNGGRVAIPTTFWKPKAEIMERYRKPRALLNMIQSAVAAEKAALATPGKRAAGKAQRQRSKLNSFLSKIGLAGIFKVEDNDQTGMPAGIYARIGKGRLPIKMIFKFLPDVQVKAILEFEKEGSKIVYRDLENEFALEFAKAMSDAK